MIIFSFAESFDFMDQCFLEGKIYVEIREWTSRSFGFIHSVHILFENGNILVVPFADGPFGVNSLQTIKKMLRLEFNGLGDLEDNINGRLFGGHQGLSAVRVSRRNQLHCGGRITAETSKHIVYNDEE